MAEVKYDVSDVEAGGGNQAPPNIYKGKVVTITDRKAQGKQDLEVVVDIGSDYARLWGYFNYESEAARWKMRELVDALGLPPKGSIKDIATKGKNKPVLVKVIAGNAGPGREDEYRAKMGKLVKPGSEEEAAAASADTNGGTDDYSTWSMDDLVAEIQERGLEVPAGRKTVEKLSQVLIDYDSERDDSDVAVAEGAADDATATGDDYDTWTDQDLLDEIETRGLTGNVSGRKSKQKLIDVLRADDAGPASDATTGGDAEPDDDYPDWTEDDLKGEIADRSLSMPEGRVTKDKLIAVLRENDKNPFAEQVAS